MFLFCKKLPMCRFFCLALISLLSHGCASRGLTLNVWEISQDEYKIDIPDFKNFYQKHLSAADLLSKRNIQQSNWIKKSDASCEGFLGQLKKGNLELDFDPEFFKSKQPLFLNIVTRTDYIYGSYWNYFPFNSLLQKNPLKNLRNFDPSILGGLGFDYLSIPTKAVLANPNLPESTLTKNNIFEDLKQNSRELNLIKNSFNQTLNDSKKYLEFNKKLISEYKIPKSSLNGSIIQFDDSIKKVKKLRDLVDELKSNLTTKLKASLNFGDFFKNISNNETELGNINSIVDSRSQQLQSILKLAPIQFDLRLDQIALQLRNAQEILNKRILNKNISPSFATLFSQRLHLLKMALEEQTLLESYLEIALKTEQAYENIKKPSIVDKLKEEIEKRAILSYAEIIRINRGKSLAKILSKQTQSIQEYPLEAAFKDLLQYHRSCGADKENNKLLPDQPLNEVFKTALQVVRACGDHGSFSKPINELLPEPIHESHIDPSLQELVNSVQACYKK